MLTILHSADWHLGQRLGENSRQAEHSAFLTWLIDTVKTRQVDAVLLAGDIFDTGTPPSYARRLYYDTLTALADLGVQVVVIAGNHDSVAMLEESQQLLAAVRITVVACNDPALPVCVPLHTAAGQLGAIVCAVPFIRPRDVVNSADNMTAEERQQNFNQAVSEYYHQAYHLAMTLQPEDAPAVPIIGMGHCVLLGGISDDSVRPIHIGSLEALPLDKMPPFDYMALGHLHRPQCIGGRLTWRYSGSPLPLSFGERQQTKQVMLVHCGGSSMVAVEPVDVPCWRPLWGVKGTAAEVLDALKAKGGASTALTPWVDVTLQGEATSETIQTLIHAINALPLTLVSLRRERPNVAGFDWQQGDELAALTPEDVFAALLGQKADLEDTATLWQHYRTLLAQAEGED